MSQGDQRNDYADDVKIWIFIGAIIGIMFLLWLIRHELNIVMGIISWLHILPYATAVRSFPVLAELPLIGNFLASTSEAVGFLEQGAYADMLPENRNLLLSIAGRCATPLYLPIMIYAAIRGTSVRPDMKFRTLYSLDQMIHTQSEHWMTTRMSRHINPLEIGGEVDATTLNKRVYSALSKLNNTASALKKYRQGDVVIPAVRPGRWERALRPEEWLISHGAIRDEAQIKRALGIGWEISPSQMNGLSKWGEVSIEYAAETLSQQLRTPWTGFDDLKPHQRALVAVMSLFYGFDLKAGNAMLLDLGALYDIASRAGRSMDDMISHETELVARINKALKGKYALELKTFADNHAWLETAFARMLHHARKDRGVIASASFLWLKAEDRPMWYVLNSLGSDAVMIEAAGVIAHYRAEMQLEMPLRTPAVYQAARVLVEDYLDATPRRLEIKALQKERSLTPHQRIQRTIAAKAAERKSA